MDGLLERVQDLEKRTGKMQGQLRAWRILAGLCVLATAAFAWVLPGQAQQFRPVGQNTNTFSAPFVVTGGNGVKLLEVGEQVLADGSQDCLLTLFRNGRPAATYRTTGKVYKDAYEVGENYLNVVETWLYRYPRDAQGKIEPSPHLASSTALTRAGGSIVVFAEQGKSTSTPPIAARLTAKRGAGGAVMLYDAAGNEGKQIGPK
jgi:hypothetical protein